MRVWTPAAHSGPRSAAEHVDSSLTRAGEREIQSLCSHWLHLGGCASIDWFCQQESWEEFLRLPCPLTCPRLTQSLRVQLSTAVSLSLSRPAALPPEGLNPEGRECISQNRIATMTGKSSTSFFLFIYSGNGSILPSQSYSWYPLAGKKFKLCKKNSHQENRNQPSLRW